jgi:hypothetical protein
MSAFTEYEIAPGEFEVYTSTNKYMAFAIDTMDQLSARSSGYPQPDLAWWFDRLLPIELRHLDYRPANVLMQSWLDVFFSHQCASGLIPIEANYSLRRLFSVEYKFSIVADSLEQLARFGSQLDDGIIPDALQQEFAANGHTLSAHAGVTGRGRWRLTNAWLIDDPDYIDVTFDIRPGEKPLELDVYIEWVRAHWMLDSNQVLGPFYGVIEARDTSVVKTLHVMDEWLTWFPRDHVLADGRTLQGACITWANAFKQVSNSANVRGHSTGGWTLFNFVHTGLRRGALLPPGQFDFETMLRFSVEGLPDSPYVRAQDYGVLAQAFERLSRLTADDQYALFARRANGGFWDARHDYDTYLMPSDADRFGPVLGPDFWPDIKKYQAGTDALYWGFGMYETYLQFEDVHPELQPPPSIARRLFDIIIRPEDFDRFANLRRLLDRWLLPGEIQRRRDLIAGVLNEGFPNKYLGMALGLTLDWIKYGWARLDVNGHVRDHAWGHFVNRLTYDGTTRQHNEIGSDSKYNTLLMLVYAYRVTHDEFYLTVFDQAWSTFERLAADVRLNGLFPERIVEGELPDDVVPDAGQEVFLDYMLRAYQATVRAGHARPQYLATATTFADRILEARNGLQFLGVPFLQLAIARGTLRRVHFSMWQSVVELALRPVDADGAAQPLVIARTNAGRFAQAVVYMDPGLYSVVVDDMDVREFRIGARTVSVHLLPDSIQIGEEGIA